MLTILSDVPDPQDADHVRRLVHAIDNDVGRCGGQLARVGCPAGPAPLEAGGEAVGRCEQSSRDPDRGGRVALSQPGGDAAASRAAARQATHTPPWRHGELAFQLLDLGEHLGAHLLVRDVGTRIGQGLNHRGDQRLALASSRTSTDRGVWAVAVLMGCSPVRPCAQSSTGRGEACSGHGRGQRSGCEPEAARASAAAVAERVLLLQHVAGKEAASIAQVEAACLERLVTLGLVNSIRSKAE